jgi:hypothetical protein
VRESLHTHHGASGCLAVCAVEYGEHPESAAQRMHWALSLVHTPRTSARAA